MRIPNFRRFTPADYPGFKEDMQKFLEHLNAVLEGIVTPLQGRLDFVNNFNAEAKTLKVEDGVTYRVKLKKLRGHVRQILLERPELNDYVHVAWETVILGEVDVKVSFDSSPTGDTEITLLFIGE